MSRTVVVSLSLCQAHPGILLPCPGLFPHTSFCVTPSLLFGHTGGQAQMMHEACGLSISVSFPTTIQNLPDLPRPINHSLLTFLQNTFAASWSSLIRAGECLLCYSNFEFSESKNENYEKYFVPILIKSKFPLSLLLRSSEPALIKKK